jgi:hypothetical protein
LVAGGIDHNSLHSAMYKQKRGGRAKVVSFYHFIAGSFEFAGYGRFSFFECAVEADQQHDVCGHFFLPNVELLITTASPLRIVRFCITLRFRTIGAMTRSGDADV